MCGQYDTQVWYSSVVSKSVRGMVATQVGQHGIRTQVCVAYIVYILKCLWQGTQVCAAWIICGET